MPHDVRWSMMADYLESYLKHWPILLTICEENIAIIDINITNIVNNLGIKRSAEELLLMLKPIAVALDLMKRDSCTIGDSVMIWKNLQKELTHKLSQDAKKKLSKRIEHAITPSYFLATIVNLKYRGKELTDKEIEIGMDFAASKNPDFLPLLVNFKTEVAPFQKLMFHDKIVQTVKPCDWWKSHKDHVNQELLELFDQLLIAVASSAGVERIFS